MKNTKYQSMKCGVCNMEHNLFTVMEEPRYQQPINYNNTVEYVNDLSIDALSLHMYLKKFSEEHGRQPSHREILEADCNQHFLHYKKETEDFPDREYVNLSSRRYLSTLLEEFSYSTSTHHVFIGHGYAQNERDSLIREKKLEIKGKENFKKAAICRRKRQLEKQYYYDFNADKRQNWSSFVKAELDAAAKSYDDEIADIMEEIKELELQDVEENG